MAGFPINSFDKGRFLEPVKSNWKYENKYAFWKAPDSTYDYTHEAKSNMSEMLNISVNIYLISIFK